MTQGSRRAATPPASLATIAVDLTPVLPGGENGGAKYVALELVRRLAASAPNTRFILLTQAASHAELAALDAANVRRVMVVGPSANALRTSALHFASRALAPFPDALRRVVARLGYRVHALLKRRGSATLLRGLEADLLFCPFTAPTYHEAGIATVCTVYDLQYRAYPGFFAIEDVVQRDRAFLDACARATALAAISDFSRASAIAHGRLDPRRIETIHLRLASVMTRDPQRDAGVLARLGLQARKFLLYPANFWKHKNHEMLLTAFAMAGGKGLAPHVKLVCTGAPGARQAWLVQAARRMNLADRVVFPGYLPEDELAALMAHCAGVIFPSLYEGFGLPVVDAMATGVPVACGNLSALPEVAGEGALLFDPRVPAQIAGALACLVNDEAVRARLIEAGKRRAREFLDTDRMVGDYWKLFRGAREHAP